MFFRGFHRMSTLEIIVKEYSTSEFGVSEISLSLPNLAYGVNRSRGASRVNKLCTIWLIAMMMLKVLIISRNGQ